MGRGVSGFLGRIRQAGASARQSPNVAATTLADESGPTGTPGHEVVAEILRGEGEEPTGTQADLQRVKEHFLRYKKSASGHKKTSKKLGQELSRLRAMAAGQPVPEPTKESEPSLGRRPWSPSLSKLRGDVLSEILRREGDQPTGTPADLQRLQEHFRRYKQVAQESRESYRQLKREVAPLRKVTKRELTPEQIEALRGKPSIFIATLVKSGTKYIASTVGKSLGYQRGRSLYKGRFPTNTVMRHMAEDYALGGLAGAGHLQGSPENIRILREAGLTKLVLHVRDPRAALNSYLHYFRKRPVLRARAPEGFDSLTDEEQLNYHIDRYYKNALRWLSEWLDYIAGDPEIEVHITTYDLLVADETALFQSIFDFYSVQPKRLERPPKDAQRNFRSGRTDEWRETISPAQIERITAMIPERLFKRFGWAP